MPMWRGHRHVQPHAGGENAEVFVRIIAFQNVPADRFAQAQAAGRAFADDVVDFARLAPQAEFAACGYSGRRFRTSRRSRASS